MTQMEQAAVKKDAKPIGIVGNLLIGIVAIVLTLGALELCVRTFVTVRNVGPAFTVYDPIYGKRLKANLHAIRITPEFRFAINTNSLGMRDPEPTKLPTDGVVFIGDSFTEGYGVGDNETFPALIRAELAKRGVNVPVLNTGMGNNGNGRWIKFFEHDAAKFHPRLIVFQVMANDFDDNCAEGLFQLDAQGNLHALPVPPPGFARKLQTLVDDVPGLPYSYLINFVGMAAEAWAAKGKRFSADTDNLPSDQLTYAIVGTAVDKARATGADVIGLLVGLTGARHEKIARIFKERGLSVLGGPNREDSPEMFYKIDGHWNAAGHRRAAEVLLPEVLRRVGRRQNTAE